MIKKKLQDLTGEMDCDEPLGEALENIRWGCVSETRVGMDGKGIDFRDRSI